MRPRKLVYGFGFNDADYVVYPRIDGKQIMCPYYQTWQCMLLRQTPKLWERSPTYIGCKVCEEWKSFMTFRSWMMTQDHVGQQLDKDLLGDGKLYSPETCVFVTQAVNNFTTDCGAARGEWPIGVSKLGNRFRANIRVNGKQKHLGYFDTPEEAHEAWHKAKKALCLELIKIQTCPRTIKGLRKYMVSI
jgi:hypothetical protein